MQLRSATCGHAAGKFDKANLLAATIPRRNAPWTDSRPLTSLAWTQDSYRLQLCLPRSSPSAVAPADASTGQSNSPALDATTRTTPTAAATSTSTSSVNPSGVSERAGSAPGAKKSRGGSFGDGSGSGGRGQGRRGKAGGGRGGAGGSKDRNSDAAGTAAAQADANALFTDPGPAPLRTPRIGAVRVEEVRGERGRGLVAARALQPGELLLAVRPLALAWDEQCRNGSASTRVDAAASPPSCAVDLADLKFLSLQRQLLTRSYTDREAAWLDSLAGLPPLVEDTEAAPVESPGGSRPMPPPFESSGEEPLSAQAGKAKVQQKVPLPERLRDPDALADLVQANCLEPDGEAEDEDVYWARRQAAAEAGVPAGAPALRTRPVGLWPEAALLNHSCLPNTVAYLVGDTLFLRAGRKVNAGAELTVSYLPIGSGALTSAAGSAEAAAYDNDADDGDDSNSQASRPPGPGAAAALASGAASPAPTTDEPRATLLSPVDERRAALEESRGFVCCCSRCTAEEALDPRLRELMAEVVESVAALREDLEAALALAEREEGGDEDEGEEEAEEAEYREAAPSGSRASAAVQPKGEEQSARGRGPGAAPEGRGEPGVEEGGEGEDEGEEPRWREMLGSVADQAGMYVELIDAAMRKLKLTQEEQITVQSAIVPLYTLLWTAMGARGELEPRLADVVSALVSHLAPGSADHLWWAAAARDMAEIVAAEEDEGEEGEVAPQGAVAPAPQGSGGGGGGFGASGRQSNARIAAADKALYKAHGIRYGPISRRVYLKLLEARRLRQEQGGVEQDLE